ncbi:MAG: acyltransferase domain-containing protein [Planctomycetes bacterium]|nr:acyltransferase domain-containing protein [Planctomycetota bacterium]
MSSADESLPPHAIAVVGFAGRFPGAPDAESLFANLCAGREGVTFFRDEDLDPSIAAAVRNAPDYRKARGILADYDCFDADFFGILASEAEVMDPQHRLLLELSWAALERSGHRPTDCGGRTGVYLGAQWSHYLRHNVSTRADVLERFGEGNVTLANEQDFLATRVSYRLGLRGPSFTVTTACSTSLVAIAQAARALLDGDCDLALAGGASIVVPVRSGYRYEPGSMLSADGHCRPFDRAAAGTTFGDGAGVVVLRRLADAMADGDPIHAVMRGFAVNNDGDDKVSFTAPSISGQTAVLSAALGHAQVDPLSVGYVEAHGTATPMGDPIEFAALTRAYRGLEPGAPPCVIGSVKSSVGHLVHAAGVAGFLNATFAVRDGVLPPTLHFQEPNPRLQLERTRFRVAPQPQPWNVGAGPRRAAVSSFGVGGTNAHVVLEEPPPQPAPSADSGPQWLRLSARTPAALQRRIDDLRTYLEQAGVEVRLADVAHTLDVGRVPMRHRAAVRADSVEDALRAMADPRRLRRGEATEVRDVVLQFPGHGVQRIGMARWLHAEFPASRERIEAGIAHVLRSGGPDLRAVLLGGAPAAALDDVLLAHPALFVCECALADALAALGLRPAAVLGCSLGEFAAATVAGVVSFEDALTAVVASGRAILATAPGSMFTAYCSEDEARALAGDAAIAAVYDDDAVVLSGEAQAVAEARQRCERAGVRTAPLRADRGFHSPLMASAVAELERVFAALTWRAPGLPMFSAAVGGALSAESAQSPRHWAGILSAPVRYRDALTALGEQVAHVLVETGPGVSLTAVALQRRAGAVPVAAMPGSGADAMTVADLRAVIAHCWANGVEEAASVQVPPSPRRLSLPSYPFARTRHWLQPGTVVAAGSPAGADAAEDLQRADAGARLAAILEGATGMSVPLTEYRHWAELGFDSLVTTQVAIGVRRQFSVELGFRDLMERLTSPQVLLAWLEDVAPAVVRLGVRAARQIGDGLYGVDIKVIGGRPKVIEINDNPSIDAGYEDRVMKDALYREIMGSFLRRIIARKRLEFDVP